MSPSARADVVALFLPMALVINVLLSSWLDLVYLNLKGREQHTSYLFPQGLVRSAQSRCGVNV